jgi:hypothetical protein
VARVAAEARGYTYQVVMFCLGDGDVVEQIGTEFDILVRGMLHFEVRWKLQQSFGHTDKFGPSQLVSE